MEEDVIPAAFAIPTERFTNVSPTTARCRTLLVAARVTGVADGAVSGLAIAEKQGQFLVAFVDEYLQSLTRGKQYDLGFHLAIHRSGGNHLFTSLCRTEDD